MAYTLFPVAAMAYPLDHDLDIDAIVNSYGGGYEQRIVLDVARGPRSDGEGTQSTYVGQNKFTIGIPRIQATTQPDPSSNPLLDNSVDALWSFYKDRFYNSTTGEVQWQAFYWYNPGENADKTTWDVGDTAAMKKGRYLVRFGEPSMSKTQFIHSLYSFKIDLIEVVE